MSGFAKSGVIDGQVAAMDVYTECYILKAGYSAPCFDGMIAGRASSHRFTDGMECFDGFDNQRFQDRSRCFSCTA
ncbi:MAG TPA: hypothetical protein PKN13_03160 [Accumulibacter sp.]|nr:hypothetical protein [Accumulibacter sp.]HMX21541.1 hypothetical protein [Accumulibacter sp.]HMY07079.1 hypothetical protein [Accumulibacter sp.]HNC18166.1 hypothetical protein [Accumulibacter sp.]HND79775.1 hypothetical protein [Accumulibacter sp.]